jgi:predicted HicB family RNase H-like nuclease
MEYKGYTALIEWSEADNCFGGKVVNLENARHSITFTGATLPEMQEEFKGMMEWYLEECRNDGREPSRPKSEAMAHSL